MEQRRLRLGDILDDYCPRERRVTNHVVVAMIDEQVKQTRCSTCDADHDYKQARVPAARRRKDAGALAEGGDEAPRARRPEVEAAAPAVDAVADTAEAGEAVEMGGAVLGGPAGAPEPAIELEASAPEPAEPAADEAHEDDGPVHRRLIRATLPRPEGQVPERRETDFTVRQPGGRGGGGGREIDGNRPQGGQKRPHRPQRGGDLRFGGQPAGNGNGPRSGQGGRGGSGQPPGNSPQGPRSSRPGGEGRFRRRRGR